ncbi:MAG: fibronectin type III domain-containing protein, partial [Bacteroidales bacterium]|nr:fibronectin type III domain-containing protein [Bacteroidales bacterium]
MNTFYITMKRVRRLISLLLFCLLILHFSLVTQAQSPTIQASDITLMYATDSSMNLTWTNGNGDARLVFLQSENLHLSGAGPQDLTTYNANSVFGKGDKSGGYAFCVYNGTGNSVKVTGLVINTLYRIWVFEYNGTAGAERYLKTTNSSNPVDKRTISKKPDWSASYIVFKNVTANAARIEWICGNGEYEAVFVAQTNIGSPLPDTGKAYTANSVFGSGDQAGAGWYCVYNAAKSGTTGAVNITGLTPGTQYRAMVVSYNGTGGSECYNTDVGCLLYTSD